MLCCYVMLCYVMLCYVMLCYVMLLEQEPPQWAMAPSFTRFLDHTQRRNSVGRTPLDEWLARRTDLYLTTHNTHNRQTSMPPVGFEPKKFSKREAADLRLRPHAHWDRRGIWLMFTLNVQTQNLPAEDGKNCKQQAAMVSEFNVTYSLPFSVFLNLGSTPLVPPWRCITTSQAPYLDGKMKTRRERRHAPRHCVEFETTTAGDCTRLWPGGHCWRQPQRRLKSQTFLAGSRRANQ